MSASAQLDGRIDWNQSKAALVAAFPTPSFPNGTWAPTTDHGIVVWNAVSQTWQDVNGGDDNYGPGLDLIYRWRPTQANIALVFTAALAAGATSATLTGNWGGASGLFPVTLSSGQLVNALLANGATTCTFYPNPAPATGGSYGPALAVGAATANATVSGAGPLLGVANAYSASASIGAAGSAVLGGAQTAAGVGIPDLPRNVIGAWTTSSTVTVTGTDYYGLPQTETQTGATFTGKKAFKTVTGITSTAAVTAATFGTGNVLGLPVRVNSGDFFDARFDNAADAGTFVQADITLPATAATGDVRGTYAPAGTLNGAKYLSALLKIYDRFTQVGTLGVTPA
jgi:hypothetical protein